MNADLDIDERIAAALPRDFPQDFFVEMSRNICDHCKNVFKGRRNRTLCALCVTPPDLTGGGQFTTS
ncbi:hypothetical protein [Variovorax ginsengisoli]|uniref:Uncharacterized protein n=1 Tax=Variovorax ginsengisoli TaxID=363844 RepID=A0ABT9SG25_9BURK|nr:hypothetical protein [Variovorax ginsengisoli]MDP9902327.1 hypothetical protein [Variovorax ginsengisoli]